MMKIGASVEMDKNIIFVRVVKNINAAGCIITIKHVAKVNQNINVSPWLVSK